MFAHTVCNPDSFDGHLVHNPRPPKKKIKTEQLYYENLSSQRLTHPKLDVKEP